MPPSLPCGLYGIADAAHGDPVGAAIALAEARCATVQLRAKSWEPQQIQAAAAAIAGPLRALGTCFVVNDHPEIARAVDADGVHLGQTDGSLAQARALLGPGKLIGWSTHDLNQVAATQGADYIGFGPVFSTSTKLGALPPRGTALLDQAVALARCPVIAIGGIMPENLKSVIQTGVHGWACISALIAAPDRSAAVRGMQR
jgi:thiamine-phosphate pyrophosphorylase